MSHDSRTRLWPIMIALGLLLALSATGGAVAGTLVTSKLIKDDTIKPRDLDYVTGVEASRLANPLELTTASTKVLAATMHVDDMGGMAVAHAVLSLSNTTDDAIDVELRLVHQQDPDHVEVFTVTVPAQGSVSSPASIRCNAFPTGDQTVTLSVDPGAGGVIVERAVLTMVAGPHL